MLPAFLIALPATFIVRSIGHRRGHMDGEGSGGHQKTHIRSIPNTGGIAIFLGVAIPMIAGLLAVQLVSREQLTEIAPAIEQHLPGIYQRMSMITALICCIAILHVVGLFDDRKPIGASFKLAIQAAVSLVMVWGYDCRLLTLLDTVSGLEMIAPWPSIIISVLWLIVLTNAINFMDNMDGLSSGVSIIAASLLLAAACLNGQWFVAATLALLVGSLLGFFIYNYPPATIFMGDGGSTIVGFLLGFLTIRTTFYDPEATGGWYGVFMPLMILAIPLYDFTSVVFIRISQGRNPLIGDEQHFSHRMIKRGLSIRRTLIVICGCTLVTGIGGVGLGRLEAWQAVLAALQTVVILVILGIYEHATFRDTSDTNAQSEVDED